MKQFRETHTANGLAKSVINMTSLIDKMEEQLQELIIMRSYCEEFSKDVLISSELELF